MKAPDILKAAAGHMEDRAATYDKPEGERSMAATVKAFRAVTGDGLMSSEERGWLFMELLKAVRSEQGGYRADNYEDGTAYCSLKGEAAYRERVPKCAEGCAEPFPDTVLELDAAWAEGEERMRNIASSHGDGEHYAEDMTDPANWRAGDLVEITGSDNRAWERFKGVVGRVSDAFSDGVRRIYFNDDWWLADHTNCTFRFHSRPSQVNEQEMSGIWHHWSGGECPCDELSEIEVEYPNGDKEDGPAEAFDWSRKFRFRML